MQEIIKIPVLALYILGKISISYALPENHAQVVELVDTYA